MTIECSKLKILPSIRQAYGCLWFYKLQHMVISVIAVLPFCLAGLLGLLDPVFSVTSTTENMPAGFNLSFAVLVLTTFIWAVPMIIMWHRLYLLGPEHLIRKKIWPLITRTLKVILHSLVFFGIGLVAAIVITGGVLYLRIISESEAMTGTITELGRAEYALYILAMLVIITFLLIIALRLSMAFSSLTIGKPLGFTTSWHITRTNSLAMLTATLGGAIPLLVIETAVLWAAKYYLHIDLLAGTAPDSDMIYIFVLVVSPVLTLPMAILCSLASSFYRHCGCAEFRQSPK